MFIYAGMAATSPLSSLYDCTFLKMRRPACFYALVHEKFGIFQIVAIPTIFCLAGIST